MDNWLRIRMCYVKRFIFILVAWKHVIPFKIKMQNIFNVSLIIKGFVFLVNFKCPAFNVSEVGL